MFDELQIDEQKVLVAKASEMENTHIKWLLDQLASQMRKRNSNLANHSVVALFARTMTDL